MDWSPFRVCAGDEKPPASRSLETAAGIGDRLRTAAFAERQAQEAFAWAAERYDDAPPKLRDGWRRLAAEERKHLGWLLKRMAELGVDPSQRPVSDGLFRSLTRCATWRDFTAYMTRAEDRGRTAERHFEKALAVSDPETARIFAAIALEEDEHIALQRLD